MNLQKLQKLTGVATPNHFQEVLFLTKVFMLVIKIINRRNPCYQGCLMAMETFHSVIAIPVITNLIVEIEAFDTKDAFHTFEPWNIPTTVPLNYGLYEATKIYSDYGYNKVNIYQEQRNEACANLECSGETFYQQFSDYF